MKKRFVGPPNPGPGGEDLGHEVNVRGRYVGNVKSGEVIEIPDDLCAGSKDDPAPVWSDLWEDVKASPKKSEVER